MAVLIAHTHTHTHTHMHTHTHTHTHPHAHTHPAIILEDNDRYDMIQLVDWDHLSLIIS